MGTVLKGLRGPERGEGAGTISKRAVLCRFCVFLGVFRVCKALEGRFSVGGVLDIVRSYVLMHCLRVIW